MNRVLRATRKYRKSIETLRIEEFSRSTEFGLLKPEKLKWSQLDDTGLVLAVLDDHGRALSTMRGIVVDCRAAAERHLMCSVHPDVGYPAIAFTNAATAGSLRGLGLNQLLRFHFLTFAIRKRIQSAISPIYKNAPRIGIMQKLGYDFITPEKNWQDKLKQFSQRQLGILRAENMPSALAVLRNDYSHLIDAVPWQGIEITEIDIEPLASVPCFAAP